MDTRQQAAHPFSSDGAIRPKLQSPLSARCQSVIMLLWRQLSIHCVSLHCTVLPVCRTCVRRGGSGNRGTLLVHTLYNLHTIITKHPHCTLQTVHKLCKNCHSATGTGTGEHCCTLCTICTQSKPNSTSTVCAPHYKLCTN